MCTKMPYLKEDEIVISSKRTNTNSSESDDEGVHNGRIFDKKVS